MTTQNTKTENDIDKIKEYQQELKNTWGDHIDFEDNELYLNSKSIKTFLSNADQGDTVAQSILVDMHSQGIFPNNNATSENIAKKFLASKISTNTSAENFYSMLDAGVFENGEDALKWYLNDPNQNNVDAQYYFSMRFIEPGIVDDKEAIKWIMSEAENGNVEAQCSLGELFKIGATTGSANRAIESAGWSKAAEWFIKAAEQGNSEAQYQLGQLYSVELSDDNALLNDAEKWFKKAAEQGHVDAQGSLDKNKTVFNLTSIEEQEVRGRHDSRRNETPTTTNRSML